jgi:hypothetical protein
MSDTKGFLEMMAHAGSPVSEFVLREGRQWPVGPLTFVNQRSTPQSCFMNAARLALAHDYLTYVEGYAMSVMPMRHAWCVRPDGVVMDPTWRPSAVITHGDYWGVAFSDEYLNRCLLKNGVYGLLDPMYCRNTIKDLLAGHARFAPEVQPWAA